MIAVSLGDDRRETCLISFEKRVWFGQCIYKENHGQARNDNATTLIYFQSFQDERDVQGTSSVEHLILVDLRQLGGTAYSLVNPNSLALFEASLKDESS